MPENSTVRIYTINFQGEVYPFTHPQSADMTDEAFLNHVRQIRLQQGEEQELFGLLDSLEELGFVYVKGPCYMYVEDELA